MGRRKSYDVPVISLQIQEDYLFDYDNGVYTSGVDFETWRAENPDNNQYCRLEWNNYWRSGKDWGCLLSIGSFDATHLNSIMNSNAGFRIHGNTSRLNEGKDLDFAVRMRFDRADMFIDHGDEVRFNNILKVKAPFQLTGKGFFYAVEKFNKQKHLNCLHYLRKKISFYVNSTHHSRFCFISSGR